MILIFRVWGPWGHPGRASPSSAERRERKSARPSVAQALKAARRARGPLPVATPPIAHLTGVDLVWCSAPFRLDSRDYSLLVVVVAKKTVAGCPDPRRLRSLFSYTTNRRALVLPLVTAGGMKKSRTKGCSIEIRGVVYFVFPT